MSHHSPLRICLLVTALFAPGTIAHAQQPQPEITLKLNPAQVAEITRLVDLQPIDKSRLGCFWDHSLQSKQHHNLADRLDQQYVCNTAHDP